MASQQDLRPQQRDDREDRELGTQAPAAISVHGVSENTLLDGLFLDLNQICSLEQHPDFKRSGEMIFNFEGGHIS